MTGQRPTGGGLRPGGSATDGTHAPPLQFLPPRAFLLPLVSRGVVIWAGMRVLLALGIAMLEAGPPFRLPVSVAAAVALVAGTLAWLETRRRREHFLLGNLGISRSVLFLVGLLPAVIMESLLLLVEHVPA